MSCASFSADSSSSSYQAGLHMPRARSCLLQGLGSAGICGYPSESDLSGLLRYVAGKLKRWYSALQESVCRPKCPEKLRRTEQRKKPSPETTHVQYRLNWLGDWPYFSRSQPHRTECAPSVRHAPATHLSWELRWQSRRCRLDLRTSVQERTSCGAETSEIKRRPPGLKQQPLTCLDYLLILAVSHTTSCRLHRGSAAVALLSLTLQRSATCQASTNCKSVVGPSLRRICNRVWRQRHGKALCKSQSHLSCGFRDSRDRKATFSTVLRASDLRNAWQLSRANERLEGSESAGDAAFEPAILLSVRSRSPA